MIEHPVRAALTWGALGAALTTCGLLWLTESHWAPVLLSVGILCLLMALMVNTENRKFTKLHKQDRKGVEVGPETDRHYRQGES